MFFHQYERVLTISFDLSQTEKLGEIIDQAVCEFGGIDILINNAGTMKPGGLEDQVAFLI